MTTGVKKLIVTADDFGLDPAVNEAVEIAHRDGILTAASLMVTAPAAADAVARARRLPELGVGLHLALIDACPACPPTEISVLTNTDGAFDRNPWTVGLRFFCHPKAKAALAREIRAQFKAFAATGLALDHVNTHKHMHLHPTIARLVLEIGADFGMKALRIPFEPRLDWSFGAAALRWWTGGLKRLVRSQSLTVNDRLFGLAWTGAMTEERILAVLARLPAGISELYTHPASYRAPALARAMPTYDQTGEFAALISPAVRAAVATSGARLSRYGDL